MTAAAMLVPCTRAGRADTAFLPQAHASSIPLNEKRRRVTGDISEVAGPSTSLAACLVRTSLLSGAVHLARTGYKLAELRGKLLAARTEQKKSKEKKGETDVMKNLEYRSKV